MNLKYRVIQLEKEVADLKRQLKDQPKTTETTIHLRAISTEDFKERLESLHPHTRQLLDRGKQLNS